MPYQLIKGNRTVWFVPQTGDRLVTIWFESLSHPQGLNLPIALPPDIFKSVKQYASSSTNEDQTVTLKREPTWFVIEDARAVWTILREAQWTEVAA